MTRMNALEWYTKEQSLIRGLTFVLLFVALTVYRDKDYGNSSNAQGTERPLDEMWRLSCDWLKKGLNSKERYRSIQQK